MPKFLRNFALLCLTALVAAIAFAGLPPRAPRANRFPRPSVDQPLASRNGQTEIAILAGGCFWGVQAVFQHTRGVISATSGYTGGQGDNPDYASVSSGRFGFAESVKIVYDPAQLSYGQLLMIFFAVAHNPTELDKQGPDWGPQYRSAIFYANSEQLRIARAYIAQLDSAQVYPRKIVTQLDPLGSFYAAEPYHQNYVKLHPDNPYIVINDLPKLAAFRRDFPELYRD